MAPVIAQVAVAAMVVLVSLRASQAAERCDPSVARIVSIQGLVEVQLAGTADWVVAALDDRLCFGDTIRVGELARAALALANDSVLRFDQRTTLRLAGEVETGRSLLDLLFGDVHFFSHRPRALEVDTPIANAAAEGTEFLVRARPERTEVVMLDGLVRLTTAEGEVLLASGDAGVAVAGEAPRREIVARPRDAVAWTLYYPPVLAPLAERRAAPGELPPGLQRAVERVADNDYAGALATLDAVPEAARDARYYTYRAGALLNVGRVEEAADAIARALELDPAAAAALAQRAIMHVVQNRREEALADARRAVELAPNSGAARIALSYALQATFQLETARAVLRESAAQIPDDALVQARLAEIELSFGELDAAEAAAARAVVLAPDLARTQMVRGFAALSRIDVARAKAAFERAIELDSAEPLARLGLGLAKIRAGDLEGGRRELEIAAALDPNTSLLRSYLGKAYFEERRGPLDAEQFRIAKELDPNDPTPWFYNAIRLQTVNRPVEALRELERSIALNDNRAPFRSRLLLDEDAATRGVSLGRIYDDLGFEQLGVNEAARALSLDPANSAAHRFLSDLYVGKPRLEVARVSELLQAQLLQPVGRNPIQSSLAFTDLDLVASSGPARGAFNEFTPLFTRNGVQAGVTGLVGTDSTFGDEVVATGLAGRTSISAGQFHYETQGFRENNDLQHDIYTLFGQTDLTESLSLQAEYRHRDTDQGDRELRFDPDEFDPTESDGLEEDVFRVGGRLTPAPGQVGLVSAIYSERQDHIDSESFLGRENLDVRTNVGQIEGQYLGDFGPLRLVAGAGRAVADSRTRDTSITIPRFREERRATDVYATASLALTPTLDVTARLGYADVDIEPKDDQGESIDRGQTGMAGLTPGAGVIWQPIDGLRLRGAVGRTIRRPYVANQTLQPTQLAGFNEQFDELDGTRADWLGLAADLRVSEDVRLGAEMVLRSLARELQRGGDHMLDDQRDDRALAYLYWTPTDRIAASLELIAERYSAKQRDDPDVLRVRTLTVPLQLTYTAPAGWFATARPALMIQDVDGFDDNSEEIRVDSEGVLIDLAAGYRLPNRRGIIVLEVTNLLDRRLDFQDESFRTSREEVNSRFVPARTFLASVNLSF